MSSEPTEFRLALREAPRSLAALSRVHKDGWGVAIFAGDEEAAPWTVHKGVAPACEDARFMETAGCGRGVALIAHVRQKTVGPTALDNTHPFSQGAWIFAHNGTIKDVAWLRSHISEARLAEIRGDTDSEVLFAYFLSALDAQGVAQAPVSPETDHAMREATRALYRHADLGAYNFVLSNGKTTYAHRFGRSLFTLERSPHDSVIPRRELRRSAYVETPWSARRHAIIVASEAITDEPWEEIPERTLLRVDREPMPNVRIVSIERDAA